MTLIISSICRDGICVCADKRQTIKYSNGRLEKKDILNKIYKFKAIPIIIFNHGINIINGKFWDSFCSVYEANKTWEGLKFKDIVFDFCRFVEKDIHDELNTNKLDSSIGFVLCGKAPKDNFFQACELFWSPSLKIEQLEGLIITGDGNKYLKKIITYNNELNTIEYWKNKSIVDGEKEVKQLFLKAVELKNKCNGQEFSDQFDLATITNN